MKTYEDYVKPFSKNFIRIKITEEELKKIDDFVKKIIKEKIKESHHKVDNGQEYKRFFTGIMGEVAIEKLLNINTINWTIGNSNFYNEADLNSININIGIKTVEYGKFPVIHKNVKRAEIINIRWKNYIYICGIATQEVLRNYQDDNLIISPLLRARGTKSGFFGFNNLISFNNIDDLKKIKQ